MTVSKTALRSILFWILQKYRLVMFEKKYVALITGQHWSLRPWGNTSQHLPALVRSKISICQSIWPGWIVVFRVLDLVFWKATESVYNESHTAQALCSGTLEWSDPGETPRNTAVTAKVSWEAVTIYCTDRLSGLSMPVGANLHALGCVYVCVCYI